MNPNRFLLASRFQARLRRLTALRGLRQLVVWTLTVSMVLAPLQPVRAIATNAPQVMVAVTNSSSMDGTTDGAIMVGSGSTGQAQYANSSSPAAYTMPGDFSAPISDNGDGTANYTVTCTVNSGWKCDNGPSRLNMAKAAISDMLANYGNLINFGLYDYSTPASPAVNTTWVYYMSAAGGFTFTNTAGSSTVANPCYGYASLAHTVAAYSDCLSVDNVYTSTNLSSSRYMVISESSDNTLINDVLYSSGLNSAILTYGTVSPSNPYTYYTLSKYNNAQVSVSYSSNTEGWGSFATTPTNAGYVPYSPQVLFALRGFGYNAAPSATTGNLIAQIGTSATSSTFSNALNPETNNSGSSEIKSVAGQSPIAGLIKGVLNNFNSNVTKAACQSQYLVLLTDGLPTLDLNGKNWPPVGTTSATSFGVTAAFNSDGSLNTGSTNDQALLDAISQITALKTAGIKTYVIGLGAGVNSAANPTAAQVLTAMAVAGGTTTYYAASSQSALNSALSGIVSQIYSASAILAPVAPLSLAGGNGSEYTLVNQPSPAYGSIQAYAATAAGATAGTASWDASSLMTAAGRAAALYSTKSDNSTVGLLSAIDSAAFSLTATTCVPNVTTILNYTDDPSYTNANGCSYLVGRASGYYVGTLSSQNAAHFVGPPANSALVNDASYVSYATGLSGRTTELMFTSNDGFLYAINASTGALVWGWTPRGLLAQLQSYSSFQSNQYMNGNFMVVDAKDATGSWGSYVVGSAQGGKEHFSLKIGSDTIPTKVIYDTTVSGGSSPGDFAPTSTGAQPQRQAVQVAWFNGSAYVLYVVTVGTTSTLYEVNVATGASSSAALPSQVSSTLTYIDQNRTLWFGTSSGSLYSMGITGSASTDVPLALRVGTTVTPSTGATLTNILYVGYTEINGIPYAWALNSSQVTAFTIGSSGWTPAWATTTVSGYTYAGGSFSATGTINTLQTSAVISDAPLLVAGNLVVPQFVPSSSCGPGAGYYGLFDLKQGKFPTASAFTYRGTTVTNDVSVGSGAAFTPSATVTTGGGVSLNVGTSATLTPDGSLSTSGLKGPAVSGWRLAS